MRNVASGNVFLLLVAFLAGIFFFQPKVEAVTILAKDSQENIQKLNIEIKQSTYNKQINLDNLDTEYKKSNNTDNNSEEADAIEAAAKAEKAAAKVEKASSESTARSFRATAYCLRGKTASGRSVRRGIVAADTRVLPLGTRINISAGKYSGNYVVADTGGRVRGHVLDIWIPSCAEARRWGRRNVKVRIVGKAKRGTVNRKSKKRKRVGRRHRNK